MMHKVHKWIAVTVGAVLLLWLTTGLVMLLPAPLPKSTLPSVDFQEVIVSPAEAVAQLVKIMGTPPDVKDMNLSRILDTVVYRVDVKPGRSYLIDARSGQLLTITREVAERIARNHVSSQAKVQSVERVTSASLTYPWGPLPAYQVVFNDDPATISYVSLRDGTVHSSTRWGRFRGIFANLHAFDLLRFVIESGTIRVGLMAIFGLVAIAAVGTGYYLALPRRRLF